MLRDPVNRRSSRVSNHLNMGRTLRRKQFECLAIVVAGARQYLRRQMRRGRLLVPVQGLQVIAHELLVEARWTNARFVRGHRPEARGIRRQCLIDEKQLACLVDAEFELGIRNDDIAPASCARSSISLTTSSTRTPERWLGEMWPVLPNQNSEIWVNTWPLKGIGSGRTTSNADRRSVATISRCSASTS